jgi:hypothetical protein
VAGIKWFGDLAQVTRSFKGRIEDTAGLPLGDVLNLALFTLTIVSLVLAATGVGVAWVTYKDAQISGQKQEAALNSAAQSLATARTTLEASQQRLTQMNESVQQNIAVAKEQQKQLSASVALSKAQLSTLQKQVEIASRVPEIAVDVMCMDWEFPWTRVTARTEKGLTSLADRTRPANPGPGGESFVAKVDKNGVIHCGVYIRNFGKVRLSNAHGWLDILPELRPSLAVVKDPEPFKYRVYIQEGAAPPEVAHPFPIGDFIPCNWCRHIELVKAENLPPSGVVGKYIDIVVPEWIGSFVFVVGCGGDELSDDDRGGASFKLDRSEQSGKP